MTRRGPFNLPTKPWTVDEEAILRARHRHDTFAEIAALLPGRTVDAVREHAPIMGLRRRKIWTPRDDERLRFLWSGEGETLRSLARVFRCSQGAIYERVQDLGLPLGVPPGCEGLTASAKRTGFHLSQLRRLLAAAGVPIRRVRAQSKKPTWCYVVPEDVDRAVELWLATENVKVAARARGIAPSTLRRWLVAAGVGRGGAAALKHWRVPTVEIDRVVAMHQRPAQFKAAA